MPSPTSGYGYEEDDATALQHWLTESRSKEEELSEEEKRNRRLIPLDSRSVINPHVAIHDRDVQLLERERALVKIITPEIVPNDDERNNKISYYASSSLPIPEIQFAYDKMKFAVRKASSSSNNRYGKVYSASVPRDKDGLTSLERQLRILDGEI
jgi:hypothetical protein